MLQPNRKAMTDQAGIKDSVMAACMQFMKPLARFLVRSGVGFKEFSEVAKIAFVDVVSSDYGIRGRLANISRVAVRTGLTRKEVSRIRSQGRYDEEKRTAPVGRPERVLETWHNVAEFRDDRGCPKRLPVEGAQASFISLVRMVGGDIPPKAMLKELVNAGSVVEDDDGFLRVVSRSFIPDATDPDSIVLAGEALQDLVTTINHNLFESKSDSKRLERRVYGDQLSVGQGREFKEIAVANAEELIEGLNAWIADKESEIDTRRKDTRPRRRIGLGVYLFEEDYDP